MSFARKLVPLALSMLLASGCAILSDKPTAAKPASKTATAPAATTAPAAKKRPPPVEKPVEAALQQAYNQALAHMQAGRDKQAEQALLALSQRAPGLSGPYANLAIVYRRSGRTKEAIEALNRAVQLNPQRAVYYNELGILYRQEGRFDDARQQYNKALDIDSDYALAHLNIAILYDLYLQEPKQALEHYQRYQQLLPAEDKDVAKWIVELQRRLQAPVKASKENG